MKKEITSRFDSNTMMQEGYVDGEFVGYFFIHEDVEKILNEKHNGGHLKEVK